MIVPFCTPKIGMFLRLDLQNYYSEVFEVPKVSWRMKQRKTKLKYKKLTSKNVNR
jgi:hypothetical protein